jgi:hypothetical protein
MNVFGYSERGIVNALFYEIARSRDPSGILHSLLMQADFPFTESRPLRGEAEVLVEQSFSNFGESDAVVLIRDQEGKSCAVFIEAKVKTFQVWDWHIRDEFGEFRKGVNHKVSSSNLFTQLYHKTRLVASLRQGGIAELEEGVQFPAWSSKSRRKIGNNRVVRKATERLESYRGEVFYLMMIPDTTDRVRAFFPELQTPPHPTLEETWNVKTYGYLTWSMPFTV